MRRILSLCASSLLATGMLMAQTSSAPSAPPAQDNNASQATDSAPKPRDPGAGQNAKATRGDNAAQTIDNNTRKPDGTAGATGTSNGDSTMATDKAGSADSNAVRPESADASNQATPSRAAQQSHAGVPWLWIVIGAIALIALLSLLGGRGPERERVDRVTTIDRHRRIDDRIDDRIDRRDDDIRRAG